MKRNFNGRKAVMFLLFLFAALVPLGFIIMALWNNILVAVLHVAAINFWQALGLFLLSRLLFGGFPGRWGRPHHGGPGWGRKEMYSKWESMTPEERMQFKEQWKNRCRSWKGKSAEENTGTASAATNQ